MTKEPEMVFAGGSVAERYDEILVPLMFGPWGDMLLEAMPPTDTWDILDLATGTGIVADKLLARLADRIQWILVKRRTRNVQKGNPGVQELDQGSHQATLGLSLFTQEQHIVPGQKSQVDLGYDGVVVPDDPGEKLNPSGIGHPQQQVVAEFVFDRLGDPATFTQL